MQTEVLIVTSLLVALALLASRAYRVNLKRIRSQHRNLDVVGIRQEIEMLLKRGYDGAVVVFTDESTNRFVQVRKYFRASGTFGLEMHFPRVKWSEPYYESVGAVLDRQGIVSSTVLTEEGLECIHSDFELNTATATKAVRAIFEETFSVHEPRITATGDGMSPFDELIESPRRPTLIEQWRQFRQRRR